MLVVTVRCSDCKETRDIRYVGGYPIEEYECCGRDDVEEISSRLA